MNTVHLPAHLSDNNHARLPQNYEAAKVALAECDRVDECAEWSNQADAIASYARQSKDETLENYARRIKARATRRLGELLAEFDARGKSDGSVISRQQVAEDAGLSERQRVTAIRVANVPENEFEAAVEAEKPIRITALADMGKRSRPLGGIKCSWWSHVPGPTLTADGDVVRGSEMLAFLAANKAKEILHDLVNIEWHLRQYRGGPQGFVDFLLEEENEKVRPHVLTALAFAHRLKEALDRQGAGRKPALLTPVG